MTLFSIARRLVDFSERVIVSGSGTLTPLATMIHSRGDSDRQQVLLTQGGKFTAAFSFFILGFLAILGRPFVVLWMGPRFAFAGDLLLILAFGEVLPLTQSTTGNILMAMARLRLIAVLQIAEVIAMLALGLPVSREFGLVGFCAVIAVAGLVFRGVFILIYGCQIVGVPVRTYLRDALVPAAAAATVPRAVLALVEAASPATSWPHFFSYCFMYACLCSVAIIPLVGTAGCPCLFRQDQAILDGSLSRAGSPLLGDAGRDAAGRGRRCPASHPSTGEPMRPARSPSTSPAPARSAAASSSCTAAAAWAASRWRTCWGSAGALADAVAPRADLNGGLHHRAEGQARHAALHERRRQPVRHVRLQARADQAPRPDVRPRRHGSRRRRATPGKVLKSPFAFKQHGAVAAGGSAASSRTSRRSSTTWRS